MKNPRVHHRPVVLAVAAVALGVSLSACAGASTTPQAAAPSAPTSGSASATPAPSAAAPSAAAPSAAAPKPAVKAGTYIDYATYHASPAAFANTKVVLFFHAPWCPKCRETEANLTSGAALPAGITIVKTDFDSMTDLRQQYGVTVQHTFVQVDASGNALGKWSGSYDAESIKSHTV